MALLILQVHNQYDETTAPSVTIFVFSEGEEGMAGLEILDEDHIVVIWDIARDVCQGLGLRCHQVMRSPRVFALQQIQDDTVVILF